MGGRSAAWLKWTANEVIQSTIYVEFHKASAAIMKQHGIRRQWPRVVPCCNRFESMITFAREWAVFYDPTNTV